MFYPEMIHVRALHGSVEEIRVNFPDVVKLISNDINLCKIVLITKLI